MRGKIPLLKVGLTLLVLMVHGAWLYQGRSPSLPAGPVPGEEESPLKPAPSPPEAPYFAVHYVFSGQSGRQCHVSSLAPAGDDRLFCSWYAGSREGAADVALYGAFFDEKRRVWSEPRQILDPARSSAELRRWVPKVGNAVVFAGPKGELWLLYTTLLGGWSTASLNFKVSRDGGQSFGRSRRLILGPFFNLSTNVKNRGLLLPGGWYLLPVYQEFLTKYSLLLWLKLDEARPRAEIRKIPQSHQAIQAALVPLRNGRLLAFFRNASPEEPRYILRAESRDGGRSWSSPQPTTLPNPNAGFDMLPLANGTILGVVNPTFQDRSTLALVLSRDGGITWQTRMVLEDTPAREYSYPSLWRTRNYYHLTYTFERSRLKHVVFNEAWLWEGKTGED